MGIVATQTEVSSGIQAPKVLLSSDGNLSAEESPSSRTSTFSSIPRLQTGFTSSVLACLHYAFLPAGYPNSVTPDYLSFQIWDTIQALSSYVRGMLSTQAMLRGIGVGSATATPASAVVQFFYRDAVGLLAGVLFAALQGSSFDAYAKQWRLVADVANDIGLAAELAAPAFSPNTFLLLACIGSICRAITGCAGGATRVVLTQHFALQGNAADIAAKEVSQETAVTLIGMILGLGLTRIAANNVTAAWTAFIAMTVLHVYANIRAMRCLCITRLNSERLDILVEKYYDYDDGKRKKEKIQRVPTPMQVAGLERLLPPIVTQWLGALKRVFFRVKNQHWAVVVAPDLTKLNTRTRKCVADRVSRSITNSINDGILVVSDLETKKVYVFILQQGGDDGSECRQLVQGYCKARYVAIELENRLRNSTNTSENEARFLFDSEEVDKLSNGIAGGDWVSVLTKAGWCCDRPALSQGRMRLQLGEPSNALKKKD